jgi:hypothetical protein
VLGLSLLKIKSKQAAYSAALSLPVSRLVVRTLTGDLALTARASFRFK